MAENHPDSQVVRVYATCSVSTVDDGQVRYVDDIGRVWRNRRGNPPAELVARLCGDKIKEIRPA